MQQYAGFWMKEINAHNNALEYIDMKKLLHKVFGLALLLCLGACALNDEFDVTGDPTNRIFLNTQTAYVNNVDFQLVHTPVGNVGDQVNIKIPVRSTKPASGNISVRIAKDNALIDSYNRDNQTSFKAVPDNLLELTSEELVIADGSTVSVDSLVVKITNVTPLTEPAYLIPLRISSLSGSKGAEVSTNLNTVYLKISTRSTNVYDAPTSVPGTMLIDRAGWEANVNPMPTAGQAAFMFTTSTQQHWTLAPSAECDIDVDMKNLKNQIQGIRMVSANGFRITRAEIFSSPDGVTYSTQGVATLANANNQFIRFYAPITARYIRVHVLGWQNAANVRVIQYHIYQ